MIHLRRTSHEPRVEIMPLIDVIFLLLTFFIYAMVLMVRVELLPVKLGVLQSAAAATPKPAATIMLRLDGLVYLNREPVQLDDIADRLRELRQREPETVVYLAMEEGQAAIDRGPLWQSLWDRIRGLGMDIHLVGAPKS